MLKVYRFRKTLLAASVFFTLLLSFQNCTSSMYTFSQSRLNGGTGADGLVFNSYAMCSNQKIGINATLFIASDLQSGSVTRQNCQDLPNPIPIAANQLEFANSDTSVLLFNGMVFDQQISGGGQRVTLQFCQTSNLETLVWQNIGNDLVFYGSLNINNGSSTGILNVTPPPLDSYEYITAPGQSSEFDLDLNVHPATLNYSIGAGSPVSVGSIGCNSQSPPSTPDDGSAGAPAGPAQQPAILDGLFLRAPWKVAGVDYAVGFNSGLTLKNPLTDPAILNNPSISIDKVHQLVVVAGNNVTFDGYDFGQYALVVNSGTNTVVSNSSLVFIQATAATANLTVTNCVIDGGGSSGIYWGLVSDAGAGNLVVEYNWLKNSPAGTVQATGASGTILFKYNLIESSGMGPKGVEDALQVQNGNFSSAVIEFNTVYQTVENTILNEAFSIYSPNLNLTGDIAYNSLLAIPLGNQLSMSYIIDVQALQNSAVNVTIHDNYMDSLGAYGPMFPIKNGNGTNLNLFNNFDMPSGQPISNSP